MHISVATAVTVFALQLTRDKHPMDVFSNDLL